MNQGSPHTLTPPTHTYTRTFTVCTPSLPHLITHSLTHSPRMFQNETGFRFILKHVGNYTAEIQSSQFCLAAAG